MLLFSIYTKTSHLANHSLLCSRQCWVCSHQWPAARWRDAHGAQGTREEATFPKHMAQRASAASRSFPAGFYRKTFVGHFAFSRWYQDLKSSSLQRSNNWTESPGVHSQWWPLHTQQNWLNVHSFTCSFSKASRSITLISDTLFYWRFLVEINASMAAVQKCKDSLEKSNINGSYLAVWQSFFHWYFSLGTSS